MRILSSAVGLLVFGAALSLTAYAGQLGVTRAPGVSHPSPTAGHIRGNGSALHPYPAPPAGPTSGGPGFTPAQGGYYGINTNAYRSTSGRGRGSRHVVYPPYFTPYFYPNFDYDTGYVNPANDAPPDDAQIYQDLAAGQNDIGQQVRRLSVEMDRMQGEQRTTQTAPYVEPAPSVPQVPITVVLRDGRQIEVQNYAIMNQTFWDFSATPVRKIPIGNIDVAASTRLTEAKGAEFPLLSSNP